MFRLSGHRGYENKRKTFHTKISRRRIGSGCFREIKLKVKNHVATLEVLVYERSKDIRILHNYYSKYVRQEVWNR